VFRKEIRCFVVAPLINPQLSFNVNVAFNGSKMGDADYLHTWNTILLPIAEEFSPELVLISAGVLFLNKFSRCLALK
jgi:hypothetical protein